jgi:hypothetical protein
MQTEMAMGRGWRWCGGASLPNHMSASGVNGVGDEAHESDGAAPVDQVYAPLHLQEQNEAVRHTDTQSLRPVHQSQKIPVCLFAQVW